MTENLFTAAAHFLLSFGVLAAFLALAYQWRSQQLSRQLQATLHFQDRYQRLERFRQLRTARELQKFSTVKLGEMIDNFRSNGELREENCKVFYRVLWALKSDQFASWLDANIDHDTFFSWSDSTLHNFHKGLREEFFQIPFIEGWVRYGRDQHLHSNPLFVQFQDALAEASRLPEINDRQTRLFDILEDLDQKNRGRYLFARIRIGWLWMGRARYGAPLNLKRFREDYNKIRRGIVSPKYLPKTYKLMEFNPEYFLK